VEVTISEAILLIATIIAASIFAGAAISQLYSFQNTLSQVSSKDQQLLGSSVAIIGESEAASNQIYIWVKNTGQTSFGLNKGAQNATYWDLFLTFPNQSYVRFSYDPNCSYDCWSAQILNGNGAVGMWSQGETIQITLHTNSIPSGSYDVRLTLPNAITAEDSFSIA